MFNALCTNKPDGTIVAKKDPYNPKHSDELPIPNLEVMKLLQSFTSKGFVTETFNWQYYYYTVIFSKNNFNHRDVNYTPCVKVKVLLAIVIFSIQFNHCKLVMIFYLH